MLRFLSLFVLMLSAGPALAGLTFCNESGAQASVAIGYKDGDNWTSEGWWTVRSGDCTTPVGGDLKNRYYYYRITSSEIDYPAENYFFCTSSKAFTIVGDTNCEARGFERNSFYELDTGDARDWTVTIDPPNADGSTGGQASQQDLEDAYQRTFNEVYSALQGFWVDASDEAFGMLVEDVRLTDYYANVSGGGATWTVADTCRGANGAGPVLIVTYDEFRDDPLCWVLLKLNFNELSFRAVGGTADVYMLKR